VGSNRRGEIQGDRHFMASQLSLVLVLVLVLLSVKDDTMPAGERCTREPPGLGDRVCSATLHWKAVHAPDKVDRCSLASQGSGWYCADGWTMVPRWY
jgi:hypothetical protein